MARIVNQIVTQSKAQGFQETGKQIEELSKKQTRLANESTNTGRQFASQASGLGGLVAAYAGAAATTFALQQSFSALSSAARAQAVVEGVNSLAQSLGQNGPAMISTLKQITRGQLTVAESAQNVGIALSAGLGAEQLENLSDIATRASKVLGRDLTDSLQRLVRGVGKLEPELLDELGIFTRIEPAVERYAAKIGKAVSSLTSFERRQAFANAVIEEGNSKYRNVDTTLSDSAQSLNRFAANLLDLATKIGQSIVGILDPLISYLNKDIANLGGVLIGLGALIFSKLGQVITEFIKKSSDGLQKFVQETQSTLIRSGKGAEAFAIASQTAATTATGSIIAGLAGSKQQQKEYKEALKAVQAGISSPAEATAVKGVFEAQMVAQQRVKSTPSTNIQGNITANIAAMDKVIAASGPGLTKFGTAITGLGDVFKTAGTKLVGFLGVLGAIATGFAILDFFLTLISLLTGTELSLGRVISSIGNFFSSAIENAVKARKANEAFLSTFTKGDEEIKRRASNLEVYNKALSKSSEIFASVEGALPQQRTSAARAAGQTGRERIETLNRPGGSGITAQNLMDASMSEDADKLVTTADRRAAIVKASNEKIQELDKKLLDAKTLAQREEVAITGELLKKQTEEYLKFFDAIVRHNGRFSMAMKQSFLEMQIAAKDRLGVGFAESGNLIETGFVKVNEKNDLVINGLTQTLANLKVNGFDKIAAAMIVSEVNMAKLSVAIGESGVTADNLSGFIANLQKELSKFDATVLLANPALVTYTTKVKNAIDIFSGLRDSLSETEKQLKDINDLFGGSLKLAGSLIESGTFGKNGLAFTPEQIKTNQLYYLNSIGSVKEIKKLTDEEAAAKKRVRDLEKDLKDESDERLVTARTELLKITDTLKKQSALNKAIMGEYISFARTVEQLYNVELKRTAEIQNQARVLSEQNDMAFKQQQEEQRQLEARIAIDKKRLDLELAITRAAASEKRYENAKLTFDLAIEENERVKQRLELEQQLKDVQAERTKLAMAGGAQPGLLAMERELTLMRTFGGLGGQREQEALELQKQIREKEVEIAQSYQDIKLASEKNLSAATLDKGSAELKIQAAKLEKDIAENRAKADRARIQAEYDLRKMELDDRKKNFDFLKSQATDTYNSTLNQINFDEKMFGLEMDLLDKRNEQINKQAEIFKSHTDALAKIFGLEIGGRRYEEAVRNLGTGEIRPDREAIIKGATAEFETLVTATTGRVAAIQGFGAEQRAAMGQQFEARRVGASSLVLAQRSRYDAEIAAIEAIKKKEEDLRDAKLTVVKLEEDAAKKRAQNAADAADFEKQAADLRFKIRQTELSNEVERLRQTQDRQKAELALLRELAKLKGDNIFLALSDSVEIFREKTSEFITTMLTDVINGTKSARDVFRQFLLNLVLDIQKTMVRRLISEPITDAFGGVLSAGLKGLTGGIAAGITPMTSGVTGIERTVPTTGLFGTGYAQGMGLAAAGKDGGAYAIGGHVRQMAPGGYVGKRDSVPALLEPGEFVIRRPAAMAIGGQTLNQMNATGQVGGGNVMVNVNNQGTPQTVSGTPKISRQGENLVVDIIVKDIQNNGPIRQTLKGMR